MFAKEISLTVSNRAVGVPTHSELRQFYDDLGLLLFGGHALSLARLEHALWLAFWFPGRLVVVEMFLLSLFASAGAEIWRRTAERCSISREFVRWVSGLGVVALWIGIAVVTPLAMFPAFAVDSGLAGTNEFLLALLVVFAIGTSFRFVGSAPYGVWTKRVLSALLAIAVLWITITQVRSFTQLTMDSGRMAGPAESDGFRWIADHMAGKVVMTNVDPILVGFFTRESAYGGCHRPSLPPNSVEMNACFVRSFKLNRAAALPVPRAFVWYERGQSFCTKAEECTTRGEIAKTYPALFENARLAVFDLTVVK
jgi:hypothetical protein